MSQLSEYWDEGVQTKVEKAEYFCVRDNNSGATSTFMVCYKIPGEQHILCNGLYEWAATWLVDKLNRDGAYPKPR